MFEYSILMSVYKKEKPENLIQSIESMLNQTIKSNDFVIVKDGTLPEELNKIIKNFSKQNICINVIELEKNVGLGKALNIGVLECKNEWIARMDSDDISSPDRIEKQMKIAIEKDLDMVGTNIIEFEKNKENIISKRIMPKNDEEIKKYAKRRNPFGHPSMFLKKQRIIDAGNYDNNSNCEDYNLWIRMFENGSKAYNIQEFLVYMRVGKDFYKRRGGLKYLKSILKFKTKQYQKGIYSLKDYLISSIASIVVCLLPNPIRKIIYVRCLRN